MTHWEQERDADPGCWCETVQDALDAGLQVVKMQPDAFEGGGFCCTGWDTPLEQRTLELPPSTALTYKVAALPFKYQERDRLIRAFQSACDVWTRLTGVRFTRVTRDGPLPVDFLVRGAVPNEKREQPNQVIESFHWSSPHAHVIKVFPAIRDAPLHTTFLHALGHLLGFSHAHPYLPLEQRLQLMTAPRLAYAQRPIDAYSIMTPLGITESTGLSPSDIQQALVLWGRK
jgi:hypothetical protein